MFDTKAIKDKKYISLETFRKNKESVKVPVWFVLLDGIIHVVTREDTGKIKRIRNNPSVSIALCTFNGKPLGEYFPGTAKFVDEKTSNAAIDLRKKKYGFMERIARFASRKKGKLIVFSIQIK